MGSIGSAGSTHTSGSQTSNHGVSGAAVADIIKSLRNIVPNLEPKEQRTVNGSSEVIEGEYESQHPDRGVVKSAATMIAHAMKKAGEWAIEAATKAGREKLRS